MSDERLRELERRWKETGSVEDEAAYLVERVRVGNLEREMLELAALCNHPAATEICGTTVIDTSNPTWLGEAVAKIVNFGETAVIRAIIAAIQPTLVVWDEVLERTTIRSRSPYRALELIESWLLCPSLDLLDSFRETREDLGLAAGSTQVLSSYRDLLMRAEHVPLAIIEVHSLTNPPEDHSDISPEPLRTVSLVQAVLHCSNALRLEGETIEKIHWGLLHRIQNDLIPWALGYSDPVRERVEARQRQQTGTS